mgnify:CR=1 FL=1|tara:strand:- start:416 stop:652 length:237 start_codon:yes stop_codon:yes gene_type:complete
MTDNIISLGLADWISDCEPNYPSFEECKEWIEIKSDGNLYSITKKDEEDIKMLLKYIPMNQIMNKNITSRYLDEIMNK